MKPENLRLAVVPLGAAALAGVLWLSGIPLSNASGSSDGVRLESDGPQATLVVSDLEPGESVSRTISITNPGSAPTRLSMTELGDPASYDADGVSLVIEREGVRLYSGRLGAMSDVETDQGWVPAGGRVTFTFTVSLPDGAPALGAQESVSYAWETSS
jgi:hypothetical protein